jgi:aromatic-L-amino-acid decarboxylase
MIPERLEERIKEDQAHGHIPTCVISTIGSTGTGAIDPVAEISRIAGHYGLWHHVDAAYAGTALMLDELADLRNGLDGADSFVFNPHKWMFVQFDCTAYYVRDPELLVRTMSINPSYLVTAQGDLVHDYRDWGIPLGRRFRALKLWMTVQLLGTDAIKERLRHHMLLARQVEEWIAADPDFELAYPRTFNIVTFRIRTSLDPDGSLTKKLCTRINDSGKAYMTHAVVQGRSLIRWVTGQTYTQMEHVIDTWELVQSLK